MAGDIYIHSTAVVSPDARIGSGTKIWHQAQVRENAELGEQCVIGKDVYIDKEVRIGHRVKIQNSVSVYQGVTIEDDVFVGPHAAFTNDKYPRADNPDWVVIPTLVRRGASIGANATIVCGVTIGERAMVGAGAVVTRDVAPGVLVVGNPARPVRNPDHVVPDEFKGPLSVMVVGYGAMGSSHARVLVSLPREFSLKVIADTNPTNLHRARLQHPTAIVTSDYRSFIAAVDAVVIASPTNTHLAITRSLLAEGKHCLLEKPCTCNLASTQELIDIANVHGVVLQVGHVERFNPAVLALFSLLKNEQILSITAQRWGMAARESDVDVVLDLMIHDLELVAAMLEQDPIDICAQRMGCQEQLDAVAAMVKYSGGVHATFSASRITPKRHRVLHVTTSDTHYELDFTRRTLRAYSSIPPSDTASLGGNEIRIMEFASGADPLTRQALAFATSVRERAPLKVSHASVLAAMELADSLKRHLGIQQ